MPITRDELALALTHLGDLAHDSLQIVAAEALAAQRYPHLDPAAPALVLGPAGPDLAARIAAALRWPTRRHTRARCWTMRAGTS